MLTMGMAASVNSNSGLLLCTPPFTGQPSGGHANAFGVAFQCLGVPHISFPGVSNLLIFASTYHSSIQL